MDYLENAPKDFVPIAFIIGGTVVEMIGASPSLAMALLNNPVIAKVPNQDIRPGCRYDGKDFDCSNVNEQLPVQITNPQTHISSEKEETIYVSIPAFNEEDLLLTITTCLNQANDPSKVVIGIAMQYTDGKWPNLSAFPDIRAIRIDEPVGIGTCPTRDLAASMMDGEGYYLQIDAHTIFKKNWDILLKARYKELKKEFDKPIITTYVPFWYKDKQSGEILGMGENRDFTKDHVPWALQFKNIVDDGPDKETVLSADGVLTPTPLHINYDDKPYYEHHLVSGHFLFTDSQFLLDVPFDPECTYHEENTTPLRAWTRGYRMFSIQEDVLWTREMFYGRDVVNSWRSNVEKAPEGVMDFKEKIALGTLRNKDILTGKVLGIWGAPTQELLDEYEKAAKVDYKKFYEDMYKLVEENRGRYYAAEALYELDKKVNG